MGESFNKILALLRDRADYDARLKLLPYDGTPEIKVRDEQRYLYSESVLEIVLRLLMSASIQMSSINKCLEMPGKQENCEN